MIDAATAATVLGRGDPAPGHRSARGAESLLRNKARPDGLAIDSCELHGTPSQQLMITPKSGRMTPRA